MRLNDRQREQLAKTLHDLAKIIFGLAIVSPLVSTEKPEPWVLSATFLTFTLILVFGILVVKGEN